MGDHILTAPTPAEYTLHQLGLTFTKGFGLLFCQASTKMELEPIQHTRDRDTRNDNKGIHRDALV